MTVIEMQRRARKLAARGLHICKNFEMLAPCPPASDGPASYLVQDTSALPTEDDAKRVNDGHRNAEKAHSGI